MTPKLLRYEYNQRYLVWDFESVSLGLCRGGDDLIQSPWQLGWSLYEGRSLIEQCEEYIFWPDLIQKMNRWGKAARCINGFDEIKYKELASDPTKILDRFEKHLYNKSVISITANGYGFDYALHNIYRGFIDRPTDYSYMRNHADIQVIYKANYLGLPIPPIGTDEFLAFSIKMSEFHTKNLKPNLAFLCKTYNVPYDSARHHKEASYDCEISFNVFQEMISKIDIKVVKDNEDV